jgi:outer membrane protein
MLSLPASHLRVARVLLFALTTMLGALPAWSQAAVAEPPKPASWQVRAGGLLLQAPQYTGGKGTRGVLFPYLSAEYGDWFFFDPVRGVGVEAEPLPGLSTSAALGVDLSARRSSDDARLRGTRNVPEAFAMHLGAEWEHGPWFVSNDLVLRLGDAGRRGMLMDTSAGANFFAQGALSMGAGVTVRHADARYNRNIFGITAAESAASGLPAWHPGAGWNGSGVFARALLQLDDRWSLAARGGVNLLRGSAAGSPTVADRQQPFLLLVLSRAL